MFSWLYLPNLAPEERNVWLSDFLVTRIKPIQPSIRKIYLDVLQALKLAVQLGGYPNIQNEHSADTEACVVNIIQNLVELHINCSTSQRVALKNQLALFQEMINFLREEIIFSVPIKDLQSLFRDIYTKVIDLGLLVFSLYEDGEEKEDMALGEVNLAPVLDFLESFNQHISTVMYLAIRKAFQSDLPRIHGLAYVDFLLDNLKEFQSRHSDALASVTSQLQIIQKELQHFRPFLLAVAEGRYSDLKKIQNCVAQLIGKAYMVEYIVDACIRKNAPIWFLKRWLLDIIEEIPLIRDEVAEMHEKKMIGDAMCTATAHISSNLTRSPRMNEETVGFKDVIEKLTNQLIEGTKRRDVLSIVGMPGLGKTTLAYKLYSDSLVVSHFDIRAQCCVSHVYSRKDLLLALLHDVTGEGSEHKEKHAHEIADELRKALFPKRYLILVDDVWDASAWDDFVGCFQDANNGSRIILTTRNHEVATYAKFQSEPLPLRMFNDNESWDLLRKKVVGGKKCFPSLLNIGKLIAKKCGGLPLSVALVAGILAGVEKREECWEQVANNLGTYIHNDSRAIIEHSYQNLPYHLRSCFLYFGAFLEDKVIHVSKLIQLWISEAFIISCEGKSLEDIAEGYLENLVERNLVMLTKKSYGGKIEGCRIHDLLHDFCKERAKEENFLLWIKRDHNANPSSSAYYYKPFAYRMFISRPHIGAIILFNGPAFDFSQKLQNFKFLKVLDLELTRISFFPTDLVYLRYFAAKTLASRIPSSLPYSNWNLETLILHKFPEKELPVTLYEMLKLRHLHIDDCRFTTENEEEFLENSKSLYNLTSLSCRCFSSIHDLELILGKTPNLRELCFKIETIPYNFQDYVLNFSSRIETLDISHVFGSALIFPFCISAPNLKNLTLDQFVMHPPNLSNIASLQKLQFLKLSRIEFVNGIWEVSNGEFPELKVLELRRLGSTFNEWNISEDAFCKLEHLVLWGCEYLKEVPSCFADMFSLKSIEVNYCNKFVNQSVREIRELQVEEYQNTGFEVFIKER